MTELEYAEFTRTQVIEYARQLTLAGESSELESTAVARERLNDLLTDRVRTAGHTFFAARAADRATHVGWVWLSPAPAFLGPGHERTLWISQLTVDEPHRRLGFGRAILRAIEQYAVTRGTEQLWLRVFDWNAVARRLYESSGFELATQFATDAHLRKYLNRTG
ncbi:MAG TPA: GNAT family N-acetyltransferase [Polyangiaceae bacterium]|jgi:GNAT superfamily N-acetyltransferase